MWRIVPKDNGTISIEPQDAANFVEPATLRFLAKELSKELGSDLIRLETLLSDIDQQQSFLKYDCLFFFTGSFGHLNYFHHNDEAEFGSYNVEEKRREIYARLPLQHWITILELYKEYLISTLPAERVQSFAYDDALAARFIQLINDIAVLDAQQAMRSGLSFLTMHDHASLEGRSQTEIDGFLFEYMKRIGFSRSYGWAECSNGNAHPVRTTLNETKDLLRRLMTIDLVTGFAVHDESAVKKADRLGASFVSCFKPGASFYYANTGLKLKELPRTENVTPFTFEGGVVGVDDQKVAFLWFGGED